MNIPRLLLLSFLVTSSLWSRAQSNNPVGGHFGVKAGVSLASVGIDGISPNIPKRALQPHLGVMYRYRFQQFVLQPEVLLSAKGGTFQAVRVGSTARETTKNQYYYASLPLLLGYIPTEGLTLQAGPEFGYALNAGQEKGPGAKRDIGIVAGVHYDFLDLLAKFSLHVRYAYGLTNISPEPLATYKNRALQVSIVYNLYPKKK